MNVTSCAFIDGLTLNVISGTGSESRDRNENRRQIM